MGVQDRDDKILTSSKIKLLQWPVVAKDVLLPHLLLVVSFSYGDFFHSSVLESLIHLMLIGFICLISSLCCFCGCQEPQTVVINSAVPSPMMMAAQPMMVAQPQMVAAAPMAVAY